MTTGTATRTALIALAEAADDMPVDAVGNILAGLTPNLSVERRHGLWETVRETTALLSELDTNPAEALWKAEGIESSCPVDAQRLRDKAAGDRDWALLHLTVPAEVAA